MTSNLMKTNSTVRLLQSVSALLSIVLVALLWSVGKQHLQNLQNQPKSQQWTVSAGGQFTSISPNDAFLKKPIDATDLDTARSKVNQDGAITGTVAKVSGARSNELTIISFTPKLHDAVVAVVKSSDYPRFPPLNSLQGQKVLVTGKFDLYKSKKGRVTPQINLTDASQVNIVK